MSTVETTTPPTVQGRLLSAAGRLALFRDPKAVALCKECWDQIAEISTGCVWCEIGPNGVLVAAETFLKTGEI